MHVSVVKKACFKYYKKFTRVNSCQNLSVLQLLSSLKFSPINQLHLTDH